MTFQTRGAVAGIPKRAADHLSVRRRYCAAQLTQAPTCFRGGAAGGATVEARRSGASGQQSAHNLPRSAPPAKDLSGSPGHAQANPCRVRKEGAARHWRRKREAQFVSLLNLRAALPTRRRWRCTPVKHERCMKSGFSDCSILPAYTASVLYLRRGWSV
jgi:hypothetical protein